MNLKFIKIKDIIKFIFILSLLKSFECINNHENINSTEYNTSFINDINSTSFIDYETNTTTFIDYETNTTSFINDINSTTFIDYDTNTITFINDANTITFINETNTTSFINDINSTTFIDYETNTTSFINDINSTTFINDTNSTSFIDYDINSTTFIDYDTNTTSFINDINSTSFIDYETNTTSFINDINSTTFINDINSTTFINDTNSTSFIDYNTNSTSFIDYKTTSIGSLNNVKLTSSVKYNKIKLFNLSTCSINNSYIQVYFEDYQKQNKLSYIETSLLYILYKISCKLPCINIKKEKLCDNIACKCFDTITCDDKFEKIILRRERRSIRRDEKRSISQSSFRKNVITLNKNSKIFTSDTVKKMGLSVAIGTIGGNTINEIMNKRDFIYINRIPSGYIYCPHCDFNVYYDNELISNCKDINILYIIFTCIILVIIIYLAVSYMWHVC
jgi:hypothetical protein